MRLVYATVLPRFAIFLPCASVRIEYDGKYKINKCGVDEIGCFDVKGVRLFLDDDTILVVRYTNGIWRIEIERKGTAPYQHEVCAGNDEADYSDIFCTESDVIAHEIIR